MLEGDVGTSESSGYSNIMLHFHFIVMLDRGVDTKPLVLQIYHLLLLRPAQGGLEFGEHWTNNPLCHSDIEATFVFSIDVDVRAEYGDQSLRNFAIVSERLQQRTAIAVDAR